MKERDFERMKALADIAVDFFVKGDNNRVCTIVRASANPTLVAVMVADALNTEYADRFIRMIAEVPFD